jgi:hypothetical protein
MRPTETITIEINEYHFRSLHMRNERIVETPSACKDDNSDKESSSPKPSLPKLIPPPD